MPISPFSLRGDHVELVPLDPTMGVELTAAATADRATYEFTTVPADERAMRRYIDDLCTQRDRGTVIPFAQRRLADGALVGCTRLIEPRHWLGRDDPDEVEIGGTWLAASAQRSAINTDAKRLLLTHAFERWRTGRVTLCTDVRNARSRRAIERIGAKLEGVLRHHRPSAVAGEAGRLRDTALYAITDDDWPTVRARLAEQA